MAFNPSAVFDPGIIERGWQNAGQGVAGAIQNFSKLKKEAKAADALYEAFTPEEDPLTGAVTEHPLMPEDKWKSLGWRDKGAVMQEAVRGAVLKNEFAQQKQRQQMQQEQLAAAVAEREQQTAVRQQFQAGYQGYMADNTAGGPETPDMMRQAVAAGAVRSGDPSLILQAVKMGEDGDVTPVARKIGGRDLIVNPKSGAFQDVTVQPAAKLPEGFVALGATLDEDGKLDIRYGPPKAEGKALTQTEVQGITALNQAEMDLNTLENIYNKLGAGYGGPVSGRVKSLAMGGQNPNIAALENAITAATPNLARGVFREVGVLTDQDVARYKALLPSPYDSETVRKTKISQLRERIKVGRKEAVSSLKAAGRDIEGFAGAATPAAAGKQFDTEEAARAGGAKAGDVIELYDPSSASYRKARLK